MSGDLLVVDGDVVTMGPDRAVLERTSVAVRGHGHEVAVHDEQRVHGSTRTRPTVPRSHSTSWAAPVSASG